MLFSKFRTTSIKDRALTKVTGKIRRCNGVAICVERAWPFYVNVAAVHIMFSFDFLKAYGRDLMEAQEWCRKYQRSRNVKDLTQAWDLYYMVFRRISKQLPQV